MLRGESNHMLQNFLSTLRTLAGNGNEDAGTRRSYPRRETDRCVAVVCGRTFPVENWSQGGVLLTGDDRLFSLEQDIDVTLKFRLRDKILDVPHYGRIVRKSPLKVAIQFAPLGRSIRHCFQQVIDDAMAREFANSQTA